MPLNTQLGVKKEVTWGSAVVVDTFFEFENESITPEIDTIAPQVMRTTTRTVRYDRFVRGITGHAGSVSLPVMTKEFGFWLEHLVGGSVTTGSLVVASVATCSVPRSVVTMGSPASMPVEGRLVLRPRLS